MKTNVLFFIIFFTTGLIIITVGILQKVNEKKLKEKCTAKTIGVISDYGTIYDEMIRSINYLGIPAPVVEYIVGFETYKQFLKYGKVVLKEQLSRVKDSDIESDVLDNKLVVTGIPELYKDKYMKLLPLGKELEVYYNPDKPKQSYVARLSKSSTPIILFSIGALFLLAAFICIIPAN